MSLKWGKDHWNMELPIGDLRGCFDADRMAGLIERFAEIGKDAEGGVTRLSFSQEDLRAREEVSRILQSELDLSVRTDALGNIFARREGRHPDWPVLMTGSHLDSVRNGGKFDGPAGVCSSLEAFRALNQLGAETEHPFELAVLTAEEPNTFGISTFGSRGIAGSLKKDELETLRDDQGREFCNALAYIGGDLDRIEEALRRPGEIAYFLELHIEQMPFLEREQKNIGIVQGITGIYREAITLQGKAGHCGTTPMDGRRDALCAASKMILALETAAQGQEGQAVGTVGRIRVFPNSINATPERVDLDAEVRSFRPQCIDRIVDELEATARQIEAERGITVQRHITYDTAPTRFSHRVIQAIQQAADNLGLSSRRIVSMAGHDAAHLNRITDAGMIFIPSRGGLSHCPEEHSETQDIIQGAQCLLKALLILDAEKEGDR